MSVSDDLNALDLGFFLSWHARRRKHQTHMSLAETCVITAYQLRNADDPVKGFEWMRRGISHVVDCGCPRELWPEIVRERIPE